jgi:hypothetical protein
VPRLTAPSVFRLQVQLHSQTIKIKEFFRDSLMAAPDYAKVTVSDNTTQDGTDAYGVLLE